LRCREFRRWLSRALPHVGEAKDQRAADADPKGGQFGKQSGSLLCVSSAGIFSGRRFGGAVQRGDVQNDSTQQPELGSAGTGGLRRDGCLQANAADMPL